ncbi:ribonuclease P protein component 1 [Candidatus Bathyarchaeota archaeon]|jgi:ribonuclease P protein subunit POP4|nr:ribonuclease P protein component 1 [Candidatus Bathyarchaeota archaeon]
MMMITSSIVQDEFIGLEARVVRSSNPDLVGIAGKVVDETRNTFTILQNGDQKVVVKDTSVFGFVMPDGTVVEIDGKVIMGRPEDRIKKRPRRLW